MTALKRVLFSCFIGLQLFAVSAHAGGHMPYGLPKVKAEKVGMSSERLKRIAPAMQGYIDQKQVPGFITVIARDGKIVHANTMGVRDMKSGAPMETDTIFRIYSQTKLITAVSTMMLMEEGKLAINDPVSKYLPEFSNMKVQKEGPDGAVILEDAKPITIKHLLTMTSGVTGASDTAIGRMYKAAGVKGSPGRLSGLSAKEYVKRIAGIPLAFQPGTKWQYGESTSVLGRVVEVVSGMMLGDFFEQRLFKPLGMVDTDYYVPKGKKNRLATIYMQKKDGSIRKAKEEESGDDYGKVPSYELGTAGLASTVADYMRFAQMLANNGEFNGVRYLSPTTVDLMMENHLAEEVGYINLLGHEGSKWGLGAALLVDPIAAASAGSAGTLFWGGGGGTRYWIDRKEGIVALIYTQVMRTSADYSWRFHQMVYQAITDKKQ